MHAMDHRRTQLGAPVVHGMHTVLWCLDVLAGQLPAGSAMSSLQARFPRPIYVGETASVFLARQAADLIGLRVEAGDVVVATLRIGLGGSAEPPDASSTQPRPADLDAPVRDIGLNRLQGMRGTIGVTANPRGLVETFPAAAAWIGTARLQGLAAISRLVGMECPGLHSILSSIKLEAACGGGADLAYRVTETDPDFRIVRMRIVHGGLSGMVEAFARTPPVRQASMLEIAARVRRNEFESQRALIIGGSRGLGELTAKIIAAGGGLPTITYAVGEADAVAVAEEIWAAVGRRCEILPYDATQPAGPQLVKLRGAPSHLYYFASSRIFRRKRSKFDIRLFGEHVILYVQGFHDVCEALAEYDSHGLRAFFPSSAALCDDERPAGLSEYAMAKAAAEILCADMASLVPGVQVVTKRLPRLLTDQTATFSPVKTAQPIDVMLPIIREMQSG
jgi:NAD(P)-dependent dehydrogenase (short-subunit alcohol dehydrogenase family)